MFYKRFTNFILNIALLFTIVLAVYSVSMGQGNESVANEPIAMLLLGMLLIGAVFFTRRYLLRD